MTKVRYLHTSRERSRDQLLATLSYTIEQIKTLDPSTRSRALLRQKLAQELEVLQLEELGRVPGGLDHVHVEDVA